MEADTAEIIYRLQAFRKITFYFHPDAIAQAAVMITKRNISLFEDLWRLPSL